MKEQKPLYEPPTLHFEATHNEIVAINLAIAYFTRHCKAVSPAYEEASSLLAQFQGRLNQQMPPQNPLLIVH
jgi:hypothetical protein